MTAGGRHLVLRIGCSCALRLFDGLTAVIMIGLAALLIIGGLGA